jgi:hypothetical protein
MKPLAIVLSGAGRELRGWQKAVWGNLTNVQCKAIQNWHNESPLYAYKNEKKTLSKYVKLT